MALDKQALLAHIRQKAEHPKLIVYAVLTGLAMAIERGDFDEKESYTCTDIAGGETPDYSEQID